MVTYTNGMISILSMLRVLLNGISVGRAIDKHIYLEIKYYYGNNN